MSLSRLTMPRMPAWAIRHHRSPCCAPTISTKNRPGAVWDPCAFPVRCVPHTDRIPRPVLCVPYTTKTHEPRYPWVGSLCWSIPVRCTGLYIPVPDLETTAGKRSRPIVYCCHVPTVELTSATSCAWLLGADPHK